MVCDFNKVELVELRAFFVMTEILVRISIVFKDSRVRASEVRLYMYMNNGKTLWKSNCSCQAVLPLPQN